MDIGPLHLVVAAATVFVAGIVRGLTGFGLALVAVPVLSIMLSPKVVVPSVVLQTLLTNVALVVRVREHIRLGHFWPLIASAILGVPLGSLLLLFLDADILRLLIGVVVTLFALLLLAGFSYKVRRERLLFLPVGFASGILNGSSSLAGPPVVLFFVNQELPPVIFRANILTYFFVISVATTLVYALGGLFTRDVFLLTLLFLPSLALGTALGDRLSGRLRARAFRTLTLTVVIAAGLSAIATALGVV